MAQEFVQLAGYRWMSPPKIYMDISIGGKAGFRSLFFFFLGGGGIFQTNPRANPVLQAAHGCTGDQPETKVAHT